MKDRYPPFSPSHRAHLMQPPPHIFGINIGVVHFRTDPKELKKRLPSPLEYLGDGDAYLYVADQLQLTDELLAGEFTSAERSEAIEVGVGMPVIYQDVPGTFYFQTWVNQDWLLMNHFCAGYQAKMGKIVTSHTHPMNPLASKLGNGIHLNTVVERYGSRVLAVRLDLEKQVDPSDFPFSQIQTPFGRRYFADTNVDGDGTPLVDDIVEEMDTTNDVGEVWAGPAKLVFDDHENEELLPIQPEEVVSGYLVQAGFNYRGIRRIYDRVTDTEINKPTRFIGIKGRD